jgi:hypothetical protein
MKRVVVILLGLWVLFSGTSFAQGLYKTHTFGVGFETFYMDDKEDTNPDVSLDGMMYGGYFAYAFHGSNNLMVGADLSVAYGELTYDGFLYPSGEKYREDSQDWIVEVRGLIGHDFSLGSGSILTAFTGLGSRYWNDQVQSPYGYERELTYYYSPLGLMFAAPMTGSWNWGIKAEYDLFLGGKVESHLSDVGAGWSDADNEWGVGDGYGVRGSVWFAGDLNDHVGMGIEPFVRYWDIDDSDLDSVNTPYGRSSVYEPATTVFAAGVRVGLQF